MKPSTYRRRPRPSADTRTRDTYRATGTWAHGRPVMFAHTDRARVRRLARVWADRGALVVVEQRTRAGEWRTRDVLDGPAILAARAAAQDEQRRARVDARLAAVTAAFVDRVLAEHAQAEREQLARVMAQPPAPRHHNRARHTAGGGTPR